MLNTTEGVTRILSVLTFQPDDPSFEDAVTVLREGGLVAFPTETVYGLGADGMNAGAVEKVFAAKGRPSDNPLILHVSDMAQVEAVVSSIPPAGRLLGERFWPGPLTLVLPSNGSVASAACAGLPTVAVRIPDHPVPRLLSERLGRGIVGPSANISGRPSPTTAQHVFEDLRDKVDRILDAGSTSIGVESTVVDVTQDPPVILRQGGLTLEAIREVIGDVRLGVHAEGAARSPGMRYRHYAPRSTVERFGYGESSSLLQRAGELIREKKKVGVLLYTAEVPSKSEAITARIGTDLTDYAKNLFSALRWMDEEGVDCILIEEPQAVGIGETILDRLRRASEQADDGSISIV